PVVQRVDPLPGTGDQFGGLGGAGAGPLRGHGGRAVGGGGGGRDGGGDGGGGGSGGHRGSSLDGMRCPGAARPRRTQAPRALSARGAWEVACQWLKQRDNGSRWAG